MKKWLIGAVVVVIVVAALVFGLKTVSAPKAVVMADILPQDVAFYYSIQNVETIWNDIKSSNFWKEFSNLKLWQDIQVSAGIQDVQKQFKDNIGIDLTEANFMKLAGKELVVAITPGTDQNTPPKILLLSQGKNKQALLDIVNPITDKVKKSDPTKVEDIQHKGKSITHIKAASPDQPEIYTAVLDNILVMGIGDTLASVQKTIDISTGASKESLASSENYKKVKALVGEQKELAGLFYMDFAKMKSYFQGLTVPGAAEAQPQAAAGLDAINFIGGYTEIKDGLITKLYIYPNTTGMTPEMKKMWESKALAPETMKFVPEKVLLYIVSTSLNLGDVWNMWQTNIKTQAPDQAQPIFDAITNFEKDWQISISKDILPAIGNEISLIFSDINTEGLTPLPKLGLALKVADKTKAEKIIGDLIKKNNEKASAESAKMGKAVETAKQETPAAEEGVTAEATAETSLRFQINLTDETYEGQPIKTLQLPLVGTGIAPGYTYIDDFLVLGLTTKTLQEMIDIKKGKVKPLIQDPMYQKVAGILPKESNQASFINMDRLMDIGIGIAGWIVNFQQLSMPQGPTPEDPKELEQFNQQKAQVQATMDTINNNIVPLLKTLKAIQVIATASINKTDHIEQILVLRVEDIK
jgi:hypothetical protein